jgi:hypothetical protein
VMLTVLAACADIARTESASETATTGEQQRSGLAQDTIAGAVPLHPDVVHGLIRRPASAEVIVLRQEQVPLHPDVVHGLVRKPVSAEATVVRQEQVPLHPDVVHGLVSMPAKAELTRVQRASDASIKAGPLAEGKSPPHPDVVHGLVRP